MAKPEKDEIWYPTVEDVLLIHEDIIAEDPDGASGVRDESQVQYALDFIQGQVGKEHSNIHEKAFHLMRLIASNHWFVDGNKRTALNVTELFYLVNGYELEYGDDFRSILKLLSVREVLIDREAASEYFSDNTSVTEVDADELDPWGLLLILLVALVANHSDQDPADLFPDDAFEVESVRDDFGLTTTYGTTVNKDDIEETEQDGR